MKNKLKSFFRKRAKINGSFSLAWEQRKLEKESSYIIAGGDVDKFLLKDIGQYPVIANALTNDGIVGY